MLEETPKENHPFSNRQFHATFISPLTSWRRTPLPAPHTLAACWVYVRRIIRIDGRTYAARLRGRIHTGRYPKKGGGLLNRYVPSYCGTPPFRPECTKQVGAPGCVPRTPGPYAPTIHALRWTPYAPQSTLSRSPPAFDACAPSPLRPPRKKG